VQLQVNLSHAAHAHTHTPSHTYTSPLHSDVKRLCQDQDFCNFFETLTESSHA